MTAYSNVTPLKRYYLMPLRNTNLCSESFLDVYPKKYEDGERIVIYARDFGGWKMDHYRTVQVVREGLLHDLPKKTVISVQLVDTYEEAYEKLRNRLFSSLKKKKPVTLPHVDKMMQESAVFQIINLIA